MKDNHISKEERYRPRKSKRAPTTIRSIFLPPENLDDVPSLSQAFRLIYEEKIHKYFCVEENLSSFQIRSREDGLDIVAIELKETISDTSRGYVIAGDKGYRQRLDKIKAIYRDTYDDLVISKEFDNQTDRAGFYWHGKNKVTKEPK